jgi:hypothetical protein
LLVATGLLVWDQLTHGPQSCTQAVSRLGPALVGAVQVSCLAGALAGCFLTEALLLWLEVQALACCLFAGEFAVNVLHALPAVKSVCC